MTRACIKRARPSSATSSVMRACFLASAFAPASAPVASPREAHRVLLLAMIASLVTPIVAQAARRGGWGLLKAEPELESTLLAKAKSTTIAPAAAGLLPGIRASTVTGPETTEWALTPRKPFPKVRIAEPRADNPPTTAEDPSQSAGDPHQTLPVAWRTLGTGIWVLLSAVACMRLFVAVIFGRLVVRRSGVVINEMLASAAVRSAAQLGVGMPPELRRSCACVVRRSGVGDSGP